MKNILLIVLLITIWILWYYCFYVQNIKTNIVFDEINFNGHNKKIFNDYHKYNLGFLKNETFESIKFKNIDNYLIDIFSEIKADEVEFYLSSCDNSYFFENMQNLNIQKVIIYINPCFEKWKYIGYDISLSEWEDLSKWSWRSLIIKSIEQKLNINEAKVLSKINVSEIVEIWFNLDNFNEEIIDVLLKSDSVNEWGPSIILNNN